MTDWTTLRVRQDAKEAAEQSKQPDETWSEYILRCGDADVPRRWTEDEIRDLVHGEVQSMRAQR